MSPLFSETLLKNSLSFTLQGDSFSNQRSNFLLSGSNGCCMIRISLSDYLSSLGIGLLPSLNLNEFGFGYDLIIHEICLSSDLTDISLCLGLNFTLESLSPCLDTLNLFFLFHLLELCLFNFVLSFLMHGDSLLFLLFSVVGYSLFVCEPLSLQGRLELVNCSLLHVVCNFFV